MSHKETCRYTWICLAKELVGTHGVKIKLKTMPDIVSMLKWLACLLVYRFDILNNHWCQTSLTEVKLMSHQKKIKNNNKTLYTNILTDWNKNNYLWIRIKLKVQQNGVNVNLTDILISVMQ